MIDLHNHIINQSSIQQIDWESVLETARLAVGEGVEHIVWTPELYSINELQHFGHYQELIHELQRHLDENGYPLRVSLGVDLHLSNLNGQVCQGIKNSIANNYVIVSLNPYLPPKGLNAMIGQLLDEGLLPIIGHPEQYAWVKDQYDIMSELLEQGAWVQVTSDSLLGMFGQQAQELACQLINDGLVHVVASESHSLDYKPPLLGEARQKLEKQVGNQEVHQLFHQRARDLLAGVDAGKIAAPVGLQSRWPIRGISA